MYQKFFFSIYLIISISITIPHILMSQIDSESNKTAEIVQYNSCGENPVEPIPCFMQDLNCLKNREIRRYSKHLQIKHKEFSYHNCITVSSKATDDNLFEKKSTFEDARKNAWLNARKQVYDSYIDQFVARSNEGGSTVMDKKSLTESFYNFITKDVNGVTPLTVLKQIGIYDACESDRGYHCYMLAYLRKDELDKRLKELKKKKREMQNTLPGIIEKIENDQIIDFSNSSFKIIVEGFNEKDNDKVRKRLSHNLQNFTNCKIRNSEADFDIKVQLNGRNGDDTNGLYFYFIDFSFEMVDNKTKNIEASNHIGNIKGQGLNYEKAKRSAINVVIKGTKLEKGFYPVIIKAIKDL